MQTAEGVIVAKFYRRRPRHVRKAPTRGTLRLVSHALRHDPSNADFNNARLLDISGNPTTLGTDYINATAFR